MARPEMVSSAGLLAEIHALDSKIRVLAQRLSIIEKNEQVIGKTLISHNRKLKELESAIAKLEAAQEKPAQSEEVSKLKEIVQELEKKVKELEPVVQENKKADDAIRTQMKELKYVVDMINPVAYVTADDVEDIVEEKLREYLSGKRSRRTGLDEFEKEFL